MAVTATSNSSRRRPSSVRISGSLKRAMDHGGMARCGANNVASLSRPRTAPRRTRDDVSVLAAHGSAEVSERASDGLAGECVLDLWAWQMSHDLRANETGSG